MIHQILLLINKTTDSQINDLLNHTLIELGVMLHNFTKGFSTNAEEFHICPGTCGEKPVKLSQKSEFTKIIYGVCAEELEMETSPGMILKDIDFAVKYQKKTITGLPLIHYFLSL